MFVGSCSTNESWTLHLFFATALTPSDAPVDEYRLTLWQWAQKQLRIQSSLSFNGGAGCAVLDLCRVCLQLCIPPSDVTKHSMQLPSRYEPLHCAAPVPAYACLPLCADIVFWFSFCIFSSYIYIYTSVFIYIYIHIHIYIYMYLYICIFYMPVSVYYFLYLSRTFLAHVLRPNSFHRCSSFTSHCRSFTSLPQKRLRKHAHAFHFPACFQVQLTYFHIPMAFSFRSTGLKLFLPSTICSFGWSSPCFLETCSWNKQCQT